MRDTAHYLATWQQIHDEAFAALERIANRVAGVDAKHGDDFDEAVAMAAHDAATCLSELLTKEATNG